MLSDMVVFVLLKTPPNIWEFLSYQRQKDFSSEKRQAIINVPDFHKLSLRK